MSDGKFEALSKDFEEMRKREGIPDEAFISEGYWPHEEIILWAQKHINKENEQGFKAGYRQAESEENFRRKNAELENKLYMVHSALEKAKTHGIDHDSDCEVVVNIDKIPECNCGAWSVEDLIEKVIAEIEENE